jgi:hypothetical protein
MIMEVSTITCWNWSLISIEKIQILTRRSSVTADESELCFTLNYLPRRSQTKADHLSILNIFAITASVPAREYFRSWRSDWLSLVDYFVQT